MLISNWIRHLERQSQESLIAILIDWAQVTCALLCRVNNKKKKKKKTFKRRKTNVSCVSVNVVVWRSALANAQIEQNEENEEESVERNAWKGFFLHHFIAIAMVVFIRVIFYRHISKINVYRHQQQKARSNTSKERKRKTATNDINWKKEFHSISLSRVEFSIFVLSFLWLAHDWMIDKLQLESTNTNRKRSFSCFTRNSKSTFNATNIDWFVHVR